MRNESVSVNEVLPSLSVIAILVSLLILSHPIQSDILRKDFVMSDSRYAFNKGEFILPTIAATLPDPKVIKHLEDDRTEKERNKDRVKFLVSKVHELYPNVDESLILAIIQKESRYNPNASGSGAVGLMQIIPSCHTDRMRRLGIDDIWDPYSNVLVGTDLISELVSKYQDPGLALMCYNMGEGTALYKYNKYGYSGYALEVLRIKADIERSKYNGTYSHQTKTASSDTGNSRTALY